MEAGAHHLDISGEPAFLEKMQLKYHQKVGRGVDVNFDVDVEDVVVVVVDA